jgi:hypothetical protein
MTAASSSVSLINSLLVFWKRFLYWSTGEGMDKMEFIIAESDCTTLVGESEQCQEPFLITDRASAGEVFYLFRVCLPLFSALTSFKRVLFTLHPYQKLPRAHQGCPEPPSAA